MKFYPIFLGIPNSKILSWPQKIWPANVWLTPSTEKSRWTDFSIIFLDQNLSYSLNMHYVQIQPWYMSFWIMLYKFQLKAFKLGALVSKNTEEMENLLQEQAMWSQHSHQASLRNVHMPALLNQDVAFFTWTLQPNHAKLC